MPSNSKTKNHVKPKMFVNAQITTEPNQLLICFWKETVVLSVFRKYVADYHNTVIIKMILILSVIKMYFMHPN